MQPGDLIFAQRPDTSAIWIWFSLPGHGTVTGFEIFSGTIGVYLSQCRGSNDSYYLVFVSGHIGWIRNVHAVRILLS